MHFTNIYTVDTSRMALSCNLKPHSLLWLYTITGLDWWTGLVDWTGGLDWWTGLVDWTGGLDWWTGLVDWTGGLDWWTGLVDWTGGLDWWTGLVDWTGGLDWWTGLVDWTGGLDSVFFCLFFILAHIWATGRSYCYIECKICR